TAPDGFGAVSFDSGDITEYLTRGILPAHTSVTDQTGFASAAFEYAFTIPAGASKEVHIAVPFHARTGQNPSPYHSDGGSAFVKRAFDESVKFWREKLDHVRITLPAQYRDVINTVKSNLAYILINRDGPGIQPGSRNYERSWIRDGSLTSTALLELGVQTEVREYLDWYAMFQYPSGKIPCVVDKRGADATAEHDSHGEFIYAIKTYFNFTHDTTWLREKFDRVVKTVRFIQSLRAERKTDKYKNGTDEDRALYGLVPESISHEGYSDHPRHSYWDDFFILRGLKDAADIARVLGHTALEKEFAAERDDFKTDLYASMRQAMKNKNIDYIPGCAELGDFDATSTTIGIMPAGELGNIPEPALHNTFDKYFSYFTARRLDSLKWQNYTPYENRTIGSFVYLDEKERAQEAMKFFMHDRRPAAWNHWAEVVWHDSATPKFIGDMPHTWVGSDFIRSVRAMFVYEREYDDALVVGAGIPEAWISDPSGVSVERLPTYYGTVSYTIKRTSRLHVAIALSADFKKIPNGKIVIKSPMHGPVKSVSVNGKSVRTFTPSEITIGVLPARIELSY
ncbi:MAG TPA: hypothetical protein VK470_20050, partial [Bacteroidota bacterium]|nr:hypothetical protein [Bacteroidota bacterium]